MGASVVSGGDAAPVLEPADPTVDEMARFVELGVVGDPLHTVGAAWEAGGDLAGGEGVAAPVAVVALVGDQGRGIGQARPETLGAAIVVDLALGPPPPPGSAVAVSDRVEWTPPRVRPIQRERGPC